MVSATRGLVVDAALSIGPDGVPKRGALALVETGAGSRHRICPSTNASTLAGLNRMERPILTQPMRSAKRYTCAVLT
jgi:hypothetical protein